MTRGPRVRSPVLRSVADILPHVGEATLVYEVNDQFQFVDHFEISMSGS